VNIDLNDNDKTVLTKCKGSATRVGNSLENTNRNRKNSAVVGGSNPESVTCVYPAICSINKQSNDFGLNE
jgi:hypothetical protein